MSEQEQMSQLSALFDNELPPEQSGLVIRRALKDPALRASWGRYALIGACIRNEPIQRDSRQPDVAERLRLLLAAEAEHPQQSSPALASAGSRRGWALFGRGMLGGAIAAGVAVLALFVVHSTGPQVAGPAASMAQVTAPAAAIAEPPPVAPKPQAAPRALVAVTAPPLPSYSTPVDSSPAQRVSAPLIDLLVAHSEVAASAMRIIPLSNAMNGNYDPTQGAEEMTEAEISEIRAPR